MENLAFATISGANRGGTNDCGCGHGGNRNNDGAKTCYQCNGPHIIRECTPPPPTNDASAITSSFSAAATAHTKVGTGPMLNTVIQAPSMTAWREGSSALSPQAPGGAEPGDAQGHIQVHGSRNFDHFMFATDTTGTEDDIDIATKVATLEDKGVKMVAPEQQEEEDELSAKGWGAYAPASTPSSPATATKRSKNRKPKSGGVYAPASTPSSPISVRARAMKMKLPTRMLNQHVNILPEC